MNKLTTNTPSTRSVWVQAQLRNEILDAVLAPGTPLVTTTVADRLGVSATPVREALRLLESEGLVELVSHGSATVATVSVAEAVEIYELRCLVEPRAVERAVLAGGAEYLAGVERAFAELIAAGDAITHAVHSEFHRSLFAACPSVWMRREATRLMDHAQRFVAAAAGAGLLMADPIERHRPLRDHVIAADPAGAAAELTAHIEASLVMISALENRYLEEPA